MGCCCFAKCVRWGAMVLYAQTDFSTHPLLKEDGRCPPPCLAHTGLQSLFAWCKEALPLERSQAWKLFHGIQPKGPKRCHCCLHALELKGTGGPPLPATLPPCGFTVFISCLIQPSRRLITRIRTTSLLKENKQEHSLQRRKVIQRWPQMKQAG